MQAMQGVLQRNVWSEVFTGNGFGCRFASRHHLLDLMEWTSPPSIVADLPSLAQFQSCFPAGRTIPFTPLLAGLLPRIHRPAHRKRVVEEADGSMRDAPVPWSKRLRPRSCGCVSQDKTKAQPSEAQPSAWSSSSRPSKAPWRMMSCGGSALPSRRCLPTPRQRLFADL